MAKTVEPKACVSQAIDKNRSTLSGLVKFGTVRFNRGEARPLYRPGPADATKLTALSRYKKR